MGKKLQVKQSIAWEKFAHDFQKTSYQVFHWLIIETQAKIDVAIVDGAIEKKVSFLELIRNSLTVCWNSKKLLVFSRAAYHVVL